MIEIIVGFAVLGIIKKLFPNLDDSRDHMVFLFDMDRHHGNGDTDNDLYNDWNSSEPMGEEYTDWGEF